MWWVLRERGRGTTDIQEGRCWLGPAREWRPSPSTRPWCTWATRPPKKGRWAGERARPGETRVSLRVRGRAVEQPHAAALGPGWLLLLGSGLPCGRLQLVTGLWGGLCLLRPPGLPRELGQDAVRFASLHKSRSESRACSLLRVRRQAHGLGFHVRGKISTSRPRFRISFSFSGEDGTECVFMIYQ